jgi:hypothetical protein
MPADLAGMEEEFRKEMSPGNKAVDMIMKHIEPTYNEHGQLIHHYDYETEAPIKPIQFEQGSPYRSGQVVQDVRGKKSVWRKMKDRLGWL